MLKDSIESYKNKNLFHSHVVEVMCLGKIIAKINKYIVN